MTYKYEPGDFLADRATIELALHLRNGRLTANPVEVDTEDRAWGVRIQSGKRRLTPDEQVMLSGLRKTFYSTADELLSFEQEVMFSRYLSLVAGEITCDNITVPNAPIEDHLSLIGSILSEEAAEGNIPILRGVYRGRGKYRKFVAIEGSHRTHLCHKSGIKPLGVDISKAQWICHTDLGVYQGLYTEPKTLVDYVLNGCDSVSYSFN